MREMSNALILRFTSFFVHPWAQPEERTDPPRETRGSVAPQPVENGSNVGGTVPGISEVPNGSALARSHRSRPRAERGARKPITESF